MNTTSPDKPDPSSDARMVDLPWVDGTTRTVPEWTPYVGRDGYLAYAREGGYSFRGGADSTLLCRDAGSAAVRIFTEAPEPPAKVDVPTGIGAIVSGQWNNDTLRPSFVLDQWGWRGLTTGTRYEASEIADFLRDGAVVLYEGVERSADEKPEPEGD